MLWGVHLPRITPVAFRCHYRRAIGRAMIDSARAEIAVLIGLVSTEDGDRVLQTLEALSARQGDVCCEVILADRRQDHISREITRRYPQVQTIPCPYDITLPAMRTLAYDHSRAALIAVTEDHCVPSDNWLGAIVSAFRDPKLTAVGGSVENGVSDTPFDWATFLCEYSYFSPPVTEGETDILPGMNVAYRRSALDRIPRERLVSGFWETTVHPLMLQSGARFLSRNDMKMFHCKRFSKALFGRQRYVYSRYYAGIRFPKRAILQRLAAAAGSLLLPPLLLWRMRKAALAKGLGEPFRQAIPSLAWLVVVWSVGEMVGYLRGPGDALAEIE